MHHHQGSLLLSGSGDGEGNSGKLELKAYARSQVEVQGRHAGCIPVMLSITAASAGKKPQRPVDLVVLVNVREKGMKRQKLVVEAVKVVAEKLDSEAHDSRLAIVGGQSTLFPITAGRSRVAAATNAVMVYYPQSSYTYTSMERALASAQKAANTKVQMREVHIDNVGTSIPVLPHTKSKSTKLSTTLKDAVKILDDRQGGEKDHRLGFVLICSDSEDDSTICQELVVSTKYTMHAFGFRGSGSGNTRAMKFIARTSNDGIYGVLNDNRDEITEEFSACIGKIISAIAMNLTVDIDIRSNSTRDTTLSGPSWSSVYNYKQSGSIYLGTLLAGTTRGFVFYVETIGKVFDCNNLSELLMLRINWLNASTMVKSINYGDPLVIVCQEELNQMRAQLQQEGHSNNNPHN